MAGSKSHITEKIEVENSNRKANIQWLVIGLLGFVALMAVFVFLSEGTAPLPQHSG